MNHGQVKSFLASVGCNVQENYTMTGPQHQPIHHIYLIVTNRSGTLYWYQTTRPHLIKQAAVQEAQDALHRWLTKVFSTLQEAPRPHFTLTKNSAASASGPIIHLVDRDQANPSFVWDPLKAPIFPGPYMQVVHDPVNISACVGYILGMGATYEVDMGLPST